MRCHESRSSSIAAVARFVQPLRLRPRRPGPTHQVARPAALFLSCLPTTLFGAGSAERGPDLAEAAQRRSVAHGAVCRARRGGGVDSARGAAIYGSGAAIYSIGVQGKQEGARLVAGGSRFGDKCAPARPPPSPPLSWIRGPRVSPGPGGPTTTAPCAVAPHVTTARHHRTCVHRTRGRGSLLDTVELAWVQRSSPGGRAAQRILRRGCVERHSRGGLRGGRMTRCRQGLK
jgi:hypothetical protein